MTSRRELAVREHQNWIAYLTSVVSCTTQANVTRADGVVTILAGLPMDWFSQVLIEASGATPLSSACARRSTIVSSRP